MSWLCYVAWWWGDFGDRGEESRGHNGRGGAGRFLQLLWMRYCLVVEHSWETSGHVDSRERAHTVVPKRADTGAFIWSYCYSSKGGFALSLSFALIFHLSSCYFAFFSGKAHPSFFSLLHYFFFCDSFKGLLVIGVGGFGVADLDSGGMLCGWCHGRELQAYIDSHSLVSTETWVVAQFHPS